MTLLKRIWNFWSDLITFSWLDRLQAAHPRLGAVIRGLLFSLFFALCAWYFLDPHRVILPKNSFVPIGWTERYIWGGLFCLATLLSLDVTINYLRFGVDPEGEHQLPIFLRIFHRLKRKHL